MNNDSSDELPESYEQVRLTLLQALNEKGNSVVALTGNWGTGKTHLWNHLSGAINKTHFNHIYVSVFGAKGVTELKLRVLQDAYLRDKDAFKKLAKTGGSLLSSLTRSILGVALEDAALLWLPNLIKDRLVVVDDIERKHGGFDVDELMGFIDEFSDQHGVRFLLLLNTDKLVDKEIWTVLHEKVVDVEIVLDPSVADAFTIASQSYAGPFKAEIGNAVGKLNIKNIRVLRKILATFEKLVASGIRVSEAIAKRVVNSTVLLTAIHYRGLAAAIPIEYVRTYQRIGSSVDTQSVEKGERSRWNMLLSELEIQGADDFEDVVCEYLTRGLVDSARLNRVIERYEREASHQEMNAEVSDFLESFWWDQSKSKNTLLAEAGQLSRYVARLSPVQISEILGVVEKLGDSKRANELSTAWSEASSSREDFRQLTEDSFAAGYGAFHPRIAAQLRLLKQKHIPKLGVDEAIRRIHANSGWGDREQRSLRESTVDEYHAVLRRLSGRDLARFLFEHVDWLRDGASDKNFVPGVEHFQAACKAILASEPEGRLTHILVRTFEDRGAKEHLIPGPTGTAESGV